MLTQQPLGTAYPEWAARFARETKAASPEAAIAAAAQEWEGLLVAPFYLAGGGSTWAALPLPSLPQRRGYRERVWGEEALAAGRAALAAGATELECDLSPPADQLHNEVVELIKAYPEAISGLAGPRLPGKGGSFTFETFDVDPLTYGAFAPRAAINPTENSLKAAIETRRGYGNPKYWALRTDLYAEAGATAAQVCAFSAALVEAYQQLSPAHQPRFEIRVAVGPNFFLHLAQLRALRMLLAPLAEFKILALPLVGVQEVAVTDPSAGLLRNAQVGLVALLAGADSLQLPPHNRRPETSPEFAARIARGVQLVYTHEAHLDAVQDPAAGSYFIEALTAELLAASQAILSTIRQAGGMAKYLQTGALHQAVQVSATRKLAKPGHVELPNFIQRQLQPLGEVLAASALAHG